MAFLSTMQVFVTILQNINAELIFLNALWLFVSESWPF